MSYLDQPLQALVTGLPGATAVFFEHHISFCGQGDTPLGQVLAEQGQDADAIVQALGELHSRSEHPDWQALETPALIDHLLSRYHQVHREQLNELIRLAERVETVHASHDLCPNGLARHLESVLSELEDHMYKEEAILFPMLIAGGNPMVGGPISVMRHEHEQHLQGIDAILELSHGLHIHNDACNTWRALYLGLQEFITDISTHIHIENDILFARA